MPENPEIRKLAQKVSRLERELDEMRGATEKLRISELWKDKILNSLKAAVLVVTPDRKMVNINEGAVHMLGYSREELRNLSTEVLHVDRTHYLEFGKMMKKAFENDEQANFEFKARRKNGEIFASEHTVTIIRGENGESLGMVSVIRDITERKESEMALQRAHRELEVRMERRTSQLEKAHEDIRENEKKLRQSQKMEAMGTMAGGISHDFNNILSSILGYTELSLDELEPGSRLAENLEEVYTAGKRARDLVKQILAFARQTDEVKRPIQVGLIAKEVLKLIRSSIPTTIKIQPIIRSDSLIMGNPSQVHQIFINLCTNAAHAMGEKGGILKLSVEDMTFNHENGMSHPELIPGDYLKIRVSDTGSGIAPEVIDSIFEPYFTTKEQEEGTGLGLATVHGIVESYGGKIMAESQPGAETVFTLYLPVEKKRGLLPRPEPAALPKGRERILFVDDEAPIAGMARQILERLEYTVTTRTSSLEALALFQADPHAFDLVITDMAMPDMRGDKLTTQLMAARPHIPVILCTGFSNQISEESAIKIGIKAFVYKPIVRKDLAETVRRVLDNNA